ncbi:type II secretion system F family protein [Humidisolicoccus flavus]|uniref:type II secretion system F family protein n=1 Tax=Humidisolicoccus flavus TaxID=3111414 RepID=UPI00324DB8EB
MSPALGAAAILGATFGLGCWFLLSLIPLLRRPLLLHRVAPHVLDISDGARALVARRVVDPGGSLALIAAPLLSTVAPVLANLVGSRSQISLRLRQARWQKTLHEFRSLQLLGATIGAAVTTVVAAVGIARGAPFVVVLVSIVAGAALGSLAPDWWLQRQAKRRLARITSELPTVLEFLTLSLSAGEGLGGSLRRVGKIGSGALAEEFRVVVADAAAGTTLTSALERLRRELECGPLTRFVTQMQGALERGTPLATTLRAQADDAREADKRALLEAAGKKEISMLVPLVFGLLPLTICFALWPGLYVLQIGF